MRTCRIVGPRGLRLSAFVPSTRRERAQGLIGRANLATDEALFLDHARSIHTFGMRFTIKVALLDIELAVQEVLVVRPGRLVLPRPGIKHVLELAKNADLRRDDRLAIFTTTGGVTRSRPDRSCR